MKELYERFLKRRLKTDHVLNTHHCVISMLLCLANNPLNAKYPIDKKE